MVTERSRMPSIRRSIATRRGNSRRASGSPPVSRTSVTPSPASSRDQALDLLEAEELSERSSQGIPSAGMQ